MESRQAYHWDEHQDTHKEQDKPDTLRVKDNLYIVCLYMYVYNKQYLKSTGLFRWYDSPTNTCHNSAQIDKATSKHNPIKSDW